MSLSAAAMALAGIVLQFFPQETLGNLGLSSEGAAPLLLQITGALYLGFAVTNWMAKAVLIGGIYARPLAIGNFAHFLIGALALLRFAFTAEASALVWIPTAVYAVFAAMFGYVFMTHPGNRQNGSSRSGAAQQ